MVASPGSRDDRMVGRAGLTPFTNLERVTRIELAMSAWESAPSRALTCPELRSWLSASDREIPVFTGLMTLMARRP